jgi:hypothetical protein
VSLYIAKIVMMVFRFLLKPRRLAVNKLNDALASRTGEHMLKGM